MEAITTLLALGASPELEKLEAGSLSPGFSLFSLPSFLCLFDSFAAVKKLLNLYRLGKEEKEIDLSGCGLTKLPKRVFEFPFLVSLDLRDNLIEILPPALSSLQSSKLCNWKVSLFLSSSFFSFSLLISSIRLFSGNPLSLSPMEGLGATKEVLSEMKKTVELRTEKWVHMKVMYLGNPGVGKTSIARAVAGISTSVSFFFLFLYFQSCS